MRRYLIVDDNLAFAENLAEIIRDSGAEAVVADGGLAAVALVAGQRFDALVTDMRMPVMGGARLVHEIRRVDPGLPTVVVTAYTGEDDLVAATFQLAHHRDKERDVRSVIQIDPNLHLRRHTVINYVLLSLG